MLRPFRSPPPSLVSFSLASALAVVTHDICVTVREVLQSALELPAANRVIVRRQTRMPLIMLVYERPGMKSGGGMLLFQLMIRRQHRGITASQGYSEGILLGDLSLVRLTQRESNIHRPSYASKLTANGLFIAYSAKVWTLLQYATLTTVVTLRRYKLR